MKKNPPPSTPTPRRFLLAKRAATQTPAPHSQFQSTPRFGSSSVPRPTQRRDVGVEDVDDEEDNEDEFEQHVNGDEVVGDGVRPHTQDSIEVDSEGRSALQSEGSLMDEEAGDPGHESFASDEEAQLSLGAHEPPSPEVRQFKRRRVSISPDQESPVQRESSPLGGRHADNASSPSDARFDYARRDGEDTVDEEHDAVEVDGLGIKQAQQAQQQQQQQQPVFRPAPRFKPADAALLESEGILPAAFSPQRRGGARYVPGGMAAELQGWLSEVKGWGGPDTTGTTTSSEKRTLRLVVHEVRPGQNMQIVGARPDHDGDDDDGARQTAKFILAGQGRLTGLGGQAPVGKGSVVMVGPPVWEVELDGCVWTVACDWAVLDR